MRYILIAGLLLSVLSARGQCPHSYIKRYKDIAMEEELKYGIPASIKLAQGMLESGFGESKLSKIYNNHFGITGKSKVGGVKMRGVCYRKYETAEDSFRDHSLVLKHKRYSRLFKLCKSDYRGWAKGLYECGYAADKSYSKKLVYLVRRYRLDGFVERRQLME